MARWRIGCLGRARLPGLVLLLPSSPSRLVYSQGPLSYHLLVMLPLWWSQRPQRLADLFAASSQLRLLLPQLGEQRSDTKRRVRHSDHVNSLDHGRVVARPHHLSMSKLLLLLRR